MMGDYIFLVFAAAYLVRVLLFDGSNGPFPCLNAEVVDGAEVVGHPTLFDWVRRLCGCYQVLKTDQGETWYVNPLRMQVWRCPKCLGFWVSLVLVLLYWAIEPFALVRLGLYLFATPYFVGFLVFLMMRIEPEC